ncbi:MAG: GNAT family protein [Thermomicrobiales bacterium]
MSDDPPIYNVEGELVALGPLRRDQIPTFLTWMNDFATTRMLAVQPKPHSVERETAWFESAATSDDGFFFAIYERSSRRVIGNCGLVAIKHPHSCAEVGIMIGDPAARGRGYGTEAMRLLLDYAFTVAGLHNVMLRVFEFNAPAQRCYRKVGFKEIGRRRECRWFNGRYWDEIYMDMLADEFESPVLKKLLAPV